MILSQSIVYKGVRVATGSFAFSNSTTIGAPVLIISNSGDVCVSGKLIAQEYHTELISSSIILTSGSTVFGNSIDDTHTFTGNITASGNISASGDTHHFGGVMKLQATDPRFRLIANGANHPGIEFYEDSTRKWVVYNDPDESDNLTFKNNTAEWVKIKQTGDVQLSQSLNVEGHISSSGDIKANGNIVGDGLTVISNIKTITGANDTDTGFQFDADKITIKAGNESLIEIIEDGVQDRIQIGDGGDVDFLVKGLNDDSLLHTIGSTDKIGIGTSTPTTKLQVAGDISASGQFYGNQIIVTHHFADIAETTERFIPAPSYFVDAAANNYTTRWIAPYNGELESVLVNSSGTPGSTELKLYAGTAGTTEKDSQTINMSSADTTYTFSFESGSTISKGDWLELVIMHLLILMKLVLLVFGNIK